jgi:catechol 2,3-dioxygenase-like lactoylglutathione lyase family enzyme
MISRFLSAMVLLFVLIGGISVARGKAIGVGAIGMTVSNMDQSIAFYRNVLTFKKVSDNEFTDAAFDQLEGVFAARVRIVDLRLGDETLRLTQYLTPQGRSLPSDSHSNDLWFQHIAIVVRDMDAAFARLDAFRVPPISSAPQTLPSWNHAAAGIRAFYFRDPDNHSLELIYFPQGKGNPRWQQPSTALFLGIDHTAIAVADTERSLRFYRDTLGFHIVGSSENYGTEQDHLNHISGSRVRITSLRVSSGPGIEFLQYLKPNGGRPYPPDEQPCDIVHWQTVILVDSASTLPSKAVDTTKLPVGGEKAVLVRDPDGHALQLTEP